MTYCNIHYNYTRCQHSLASTSIIVTPSLFSFSYCYVFPVFKAPIYHAKRSVWGFFTLFMLSDLCQWISRISSNNAAKAGCQIGGIIFCHVPSIWQRWGGRIETSQRFVRGLYCIGWHALQRQQSWGACQALLMVVAAFHTSGAGDISRKCVRALAIP